mmetsp:Transcript_18729/g.43773  ORF Transcript_18729/g.43773 Transcript_18729/m.43773 type:complete len:282 (-) Transcript_18729:48-893(-)
MAGSRQSSSLLLPLLCAFALALVLSCVLPSQDAFVSSLSIAVGEPTGKVLLPQGTGLEDVVSGVIESTRELENKVEPISAETLKLNNDSVFFFMFFIGIILTVGGACFGASRGYFENRDLNERVNKLKLKMFTEEDDVTPFDKLELGGLYVKLRDYPAAIAEFEEVEEQWADTRPLFDPDDTMGALAARANVHNSKGLALSLLEPPRPGQARREFVRAVTFWPECPEALLNIGMELMKRDRYETAEKTLGTAMKWKGGYAPLQQAYQMAQSGVASTGKAGR